jgi:hypothetical protein
LLQRLSPISSLQRNARLFQPALVTIIAGILMTGLGANALHQNLVFLRMANNRTPGSMSYFDVPTLVLTAIILSSLFCIYGGVQMLRLTRYRVCIATAIMMAFPLTSPCNVIGLVVGTWTFIALLRKDTRAAFAEKS